MTSQRQVERALETHGEELSAYPNVVGMGMRDGGDRARSYALAVYVTEKKPENELDVGEVLPGFVEIADAGDSLKVPVKVIEIGEIQPEDAESGDTDIRSNDDEDGSTFFAE